MSKIQEKITHTGLAVLSMTFWPLLCSAFSPNFSVSVECNAGLGTDSRGGPVPAISCEQTQVVDGDNGYGILSQASAKTFWAPKKVGVSNKTLVGAGGEVPGGTFDAISTATSSIFDQFTIYAEDANGNPISKGTFQTQLLLQGFVLTAISEGGSSGTKAQLDYTIRIGTAAPVTDTITVGPNGIEPIAVPIIIDTAWIAGLPVLVEMSATGSAFASTTGKGGADATVNFQNSMDWLGIIEVADEFGQPAAAFTAIGLDGINWATPVPVPPMLYGFIAAICLVFRQRNI